MTRSLEPFSPLTPGRAGLYTCGPTVYNRVHIGNLRRKLEEGGEPRILHTKRGAGYVIKA